MGTIQGAGHPATEPTDHVFKPEDLFSRLLGDEKAVEEVIRTSAKELKEDLQYFERLSVTNAVAYHELVHRLKGLASNLGAASFHEKLSEFEDGIFVNRKAWRIETLQAGHDLLESLTQWCEEAEHAHSDRR
jgi:HPt (histidine-containing phosphotransfer) domain-containing protein